MKKNIILVLVYTSFGQSMASDAATADLWDAIRNNKVDAVQAAVLAGAFKNTVKPYGSTPLMIAILDEKDAIAQALIEAGADVNAESPTGETALGAAAWLQNAYISRLLLEAGAEIPKGLFRHGIDLLDRLANEINETRKPYLDALSAHDLGVQNTMGPRSIYQILRRTFAAIPKAELVPLASQVYEINEWKPEN